MFTNIPDLETRLKMVRHPYLLGPKAKQVFGGIKNPVLPVYKFLHAKHVKYWKSGSLRIGTLASYTPQESHGGKFDPLEIRLEAAPFTIIETQNMDFNSLFMRNLDNLGHKIRPGFGHVHVGRTSIIRRNRHVFCTSDTCNEQIFRKWKSEEGYDAVIKIHNIFEFSRAIYDVIILSTHTLCGPAVVDWVSYTDIPLNLWHVDCTAYKHFKDASFFGWQKEMRLTWCTDAKDKGIPKNAEPFLLTIPNLTDYFEEVAIPDHWLT